MAGLNKKVACFFTGGWTELNAMKIFLEKINKSVEFIQFCPTGEKKRKKPLKRELGRDYSGLTGNGLFDYINNYISKYKDTIKECDAVLIEDDLDGKYIGLYDQNTYKNNIPNVKAAYEKEMTGRKEHIRLLLGKDSSFPVFILHASPEIEAWFYADWSNTFGYVFGPEVENILAEKINEFFSINFKKYLDEKVIKQYSECIELFGSFDGEYQKLSDRIIETLDGKYKAELESENENVLKDIKYNMKLSYSKKFEGQQMLIHLSPKTLEKNCTVFFRDFLYDIKGM